MIQIEVVREAADKLSRERWRFHYIDRDHALRLSYYYHETRQTLRHTYRSKDGYYVWHAKQVGIKDPPLPDDVAAEAAKQFTYALRVIK